MTFFKQFLKPNRWKFVMVLMGFVSVRGFAAVGITIDPFATIFFRMAVTYLNQDKIETGESLDLFVPKLLFRVIFSLLYWYLLACLIYFLFKKLKRHPVQQR